jgi:tetratricopeptide (TPR) repeat protein
MKIIQRVIVAVLFPICTVMAQPKQDNATAKKLFEAATVYYNAKDYEKALYGYQDAYKAAQLPFILFNIAQCYRFLGRYQEARDAYVKYLKDEPKSEYKAEVEQKIKDMDAAIAEEKRVAEEKAKEEARLAEEKRLAEIAASQAASTQDASPQATSTPALAPATQPTKPQLNWKPFILPGGLLVAGVGLGVSSALLQNSAKNISAKGVLSEEDKEKSSSLFRASQITITFDVVALAAAGFTTYRALQHKSKESPQKTVGAP